ncbi:MAG: hypothetical protein ACOWWR_18840 [Eubacteriales bacterium]
MLSLAQIESFYPENLRIYKRNLLREYLNYLIEKMGLKGSDYLEEIRNILLKKCYELDFKKLAADVNHFYFILMMPKGYYYSLNLFKK